MSKLVPSTSVSRRRVRNPPSDYTIAANIEIQLHNHLQTGYSMSGTVLPNVVTAEPKSKM